jgi:hypothetical protein
MALSVMSMEFENAVIELLEEAVRNHLKTETVKIRLMRFLILMECITMGSHLRSALVILGLKDLVTTKP